MGRLQRWLEARWYGGALVPFWLSALSHAYGAIAARRRMRLQARAERLPVPVIVVGNISVGGSGKTPAVIALADALCRAGHTAGVISRGYGGTAEKPHVVAPEDDPAVCGDEPLLIRRRAGVPVVVARDRVAAGRCLLEMHAVDAIVADDGLQHYRLHRDIEIAIIDGRRRFGNGRLLPAGPLREPESRLSQVDLVLVNGRREADELGFDLKLGDAYALVAGERRSLRDFAGEPVHAVAGIGDPSRFFEALRAAGLEITEHAFPDHHAYAADDLDFTDGAPVLMTEKDAVKCTRFAQSSWYAVPVTADIPTYAFDLILSKLAAVPLSRRGRAESTTDKMLP